MENKCYDKKLFTLSTKHDSAALMNWEKLSRTRK